ncbi:MAG: transcription antitermination factor NusB [Dissulfurispiraceae bacterium]|jgi:N utilization substance protein B|nr:transcription antitermination factor NusB [Dissulfurispiraceae bacterium]
MNRRKAREYALQFLYRFDFVGSRKNRLKDDSLKAEFRVFMAESGVKDRQAAEFAEAIIIGTMANIKEIDAELQKHAQKWKLSRMASIDRNIMRMAAFELLYRSDIPAAVTINEALEIAKKFSTSESASFINGLLDSIAKDSDK